MVAIQVGLFLINQVFYVIHQLSIRLCKLLGVLWSENKGRLFA